MSQKILVVMCGLPGSGKSTLVKKLVRECDAIVFSQDDLTTLIHGGDYTRWTESLQGTYRKVRDYLYEALLESEHPLVIVDKVCPDAKTRQSYLVQGERYGYIPVLVWFSPDPYPDGELAERRMKGDSRGHTKAKWFEVVKGLRAKFELPSDKEGFHTMIEIEKASEKSFISTTKEVSRIMAGTDWGVITGSAESGLDPVAALSSAGPPDRSDSGQCEPETAGSSVPMVGLPKLQSEPVKPKTSTGKAKKGRRRVAVKRNPPESPAQPE